MGWLGDIISFVAAPVTTVVPKIVKPPKILENPYVGGAANYVASGILNPGNAFGTVGGALGATQVGLAGADQVSGNKGARDGLIQTINQQNEAFTAAISNINGQNGNTPLGVDPTKPLESAPIEEEKAVERAKKRIIRPTRQGRASTILTSPLGIPGDGGDSGQGGKRLLGQ